MLLEDAFWLLRLFDNGFHGNGEVVHQNVIGDIKDGLVSHIRFAMMPLNELVTDKCPFDDLPEKRRTLYSLSRDEMQECQWLKPLLVAQIEFAEWTPDGHLRHSSFAGLRSDKEAQEIRRE